MKHGVDCFKMLDAEFACIIIDSKGTVYAARDGPCGIRPLYRYKDPNGDYYFSSEYKAISEFYLEAMNTTAANVPEQFPPGHYSITSCTYNITVPYFTMDDVDTDEVVADEIDTQLQTINKLFTEAVRKRLISDAKVGFLLSGGLDSSLVVGVARQLLGKDAEIYTFSVGLSDSSDLVAARDVAKTLNTVHHEIVLTVEDGIAAINDVIYHLESWDQTTIYAGTFQYLLCKWISKNTDIKVLLGGELSDEVNASYRYIGLAPSRELAHQEGVKLLREVHFYDVKRADSMISGNGLESRVPFCDKQFMSYMLTVDIDQRRHVNGMEKVVLRQAFDPEFNKKMESSILPHSVLWRKKEAFSDGVGHSWINTFKEKCNTTVSDDYFNANKASPAFNGVATSKDDLYFRELYNVIFPNSTKMIPHKWIPNTEWNLGITESSARYLKNY
jgi:asparagine synthase (glutamine-hydrolysing)